MTGSKVVIVQKWYTRKKTKPIETREQVEWYLISGLEDSAAFRKPSDLSYLN